MTPLVRSAGPDDGDAIAWLDRVAAEHASQQRGGPELLRWDIELDMPTVGGGGWHVAVGEVGAAVVAVARLQRHGDLAVLQQIFTHPAARGVGLGHLLLVDALEVARQWESRGVDARALPGDRGTKNFFEAHGMKSRVLTVHASLEDR